jgi:hypothetical protein
MTVRFIMMAALLGLGETSLSLAADDTDAVKEMMVGTWHHAGFKPGKNERIETVEFTKDGDYIYVPQSKTNKILKGTFKLVDKETVEIEIKKGLGKPITKTVKFAVEEGKFWFDPTLALNTDKPPMKLKFSQMTKVGEEKKKKK